MNVNEKALRVKIDPYLTDENLSAICTNIFSKRLSIKRVEVLTGGCLNRVIGIDFNEHESSVVLKATPNFNDRGFRHEFAVLKYFNENTNMPVPIPLFIDTSGGKIPGTYFIMKRVDGMVMHHLTLSENDYIRIIRQITEILVELHQIKNEGFGGVELQKEDLTPEWKDFWLPRFDSAIKKVTAGGFIPENLLRRVAEVRPDLPKLLHIGKGSTITHYDIWSGNVMLAQVNGQLKVTGLLDVQGYWADYAREISFMEMFGLADATFYQIYQKVHDLDEYFHVRKSLYNLKMHLKHIHMYPDQTYYRRGAEMCLEVIERTV